MLFKENTKLYEYEVKREGGENVMYVNYMGASFIPSIAEYAEIMARTIDTLIESPHISRVIFVQQRNYSYDFPQIQMLAEIAQLYTRLVKQENLLSPKKLALYGIKTREAFNFISYIISLLKQDPVLAYTELVKEYENKKEIGEKGYILTLKKIIDLLEKTNIIKASKQYLESYYPGSREIYGMLFRPDIIPNFTFTRLASALPKNVDIVDEYEIASGYDKSTVTILKKEYDTKFVYHINPPEYSLEEEKQTLLNLARNVLIEHRPKAEEFTDVERTRQIFLNISKDLLTELASSKNMNLSYKSINELAAILVRHTIGFGIIEILLQDPNIQDIVINAPISQNKIFIRHAKYDECVTNISPSQEDAESWAAKFRLISGRPLDNANPILDTQLIVGSSRARVAIIQDPLSPYGLAYALRRHRDDPWTLPLFIEKKALNPFAAGLLSFLVDGARTFMIAGTRSSGKTSILSSLMLEIMPKYRVIVVEDTLELPVDYMRKLGYDILRMKVRSALLESKTEVSAQDGIRTSLRLGDSALIVGEVRSEEARALYEAMRVGALANTVAGTIHGSSPYAVFDRVVNDLQVPVTSFKATDIILITNPIKSPDGLHSYRRVVQLAEVRKHWTEDPVEEKGFVDLLRYNVEKDQLEPTDDLINGDSEVIKDIAANVKGWAGNWDAVYDNIILRGQIKEEILNTAKKLKNPAILEADFNAIANNVFYTLSDKIRKEIGLPTSDRVFPLWKTWLKSALKGL